MSTNLRTTDHIQQATRRTLIMGAGVVAMTGAPTGAAGANGEEPDAEILKLADVFIERWNTFERLLAEVGNSCWVGAATHARPEELDFSWFDDEFEGYEWPNFNDGYFKLGRDDIVYWTAETIAAAEAKVATYEGYPPRLMRDYAKRLTELRKAWADWQSRIVAAQERERIEGRAEKIVAYEAAEKLVASAFNAVMERRPTTRAGCTAQARCQAVRWIEEMDAELALGEVEGGTSEERQAESLMRFVLRLAGIDDPRVLTAPINI